MRVKVTKNLIKATLQLLDSMDASARVSGVITDAANNETIFKKDVLEEHIKTISDELDDDFKIRHKHENKEDKIERHVNTGMVLSILSNHIIDTAELNSDKVKAVTVELISSMKMLDDKQFRQNPYYKNIKFNKQTSGDFTLTHSSYKPYELFHMDIPYFSSELMSVIPRIGYFTKSFRFPSIKQKTGKVSEIWMTVTPNEINTMAEHIEKAHGKVLTLGLGMGYFAYMTSIKDEVESVTIIEKEQDVIDLFENHILPQFEHKDKIKIIKADAIEYLRNIKDGEFDYCFVDIFKNVNDYNSYFTTEEIGKRFRKTKIEYWIEDSFITQMISIVKMEYLTIFFKLVESEMGMTVEEVAKLYDLETTNRYGEKSTDDEYIDAIMNPLCRYVHRLLRDVEVTHPGEIENLFKVETLKKLIRKTKIKWADFFETNN